MFLVERMIEERMMLPLHCHFQIIYLTGRCCRLMHMSTQC